MVRAVLVLLLLMFVSTCTFNPAFAADNAPAGKKKSQSGGKKKGGNIHKAIKKKKGKTGKKSPVRRNAVTLSPPVAKGPATVSEMKHWSNPDYTRVAVTLDHEAHYEYHMLPQSRENGNVSRLYIDLTGSRLVPGIKDLPIGDGLLKTARIAQYKPDTVRVVLDLENLKEYKIFTFSDPFRIIVDIKGERRTEISAIREGVQAPAVIAPLAKSDKGEQSEKANVAENVVKGDVKTKKPPKPVLGKIRRVVVDPGHGGHDPGAVGRGGTKEKDVVLQIGLKVAQQLREELGLDVVMTRSTDVFIQLQERTAIANQVGADLFLSIHANAANNRGASGIETYYLNLAKTEKAAQLAAMENGTTLEKVSLLQAVLFDLMANYKLNDSAHLADEVQKALHKKVASSYEAVNNLGVKQGPFYVLVGATMPSILVETAFLSNEKEEQRLKDVHYQDTAAEGIVQGVRSYITGMK